MIQGELIFDFLGIDQNELDALSYAKYVGVLNLAIS
jgi:hypothetical protein